MPRSISFRAHGLQSIVEGDEKHIDWLEAQLQQIADVGLPNYLALQAEG